MNDVLNKLQVEYNKLDSDTKYALNKWISNLKTADDYNFNHTSYGIKHCFEQAADMLGKPYCVSNDQFKYAMYINKFEPDELDNESWCFKLAENQIFNW